MKFEQFKFLAEVTIEQANTANEWLDTLPDEVSTVFMDNTYVNALFKTNTIYLKHILGEQLYNWLMWYIYDSDAGDTITGATERITYTINTREDFYEFVRSEYVFDE